MEPGAGAGVLTTAHRRRRLLLTIATPFVTLSLVYHYIRPNHQPTSGRVIGRPWTTHRYTSIRDIGQPCLIHR
jgi:hypothetical protein